MPFGFGRSVLGRSASAVANTFAGYDGSNDDTITRSAAWQDIIGFAAFNSEYGVLVNATNNGSNDDVAYDVVRNNSGSLSITDQQNVIINTGVATYNNKGGLVAPLQNGTVLYDPRDTAVSTMQLFSISGATVSHATGASQNRTFFNTPVFVSRTDDSDGYNNLDYTKNGETIQTSAQFASGTPTVSAESESNVSLAHDKRCIPGFVDNDTPFWLNSTDSGATVQPFKIDLGTGGAQSPTTFTGTPTTAQTVAQFNTANSTNFGAPFEFNRNGTSPFNAVAFNDIAILVRHEGGGSGNKFVFDTYKNGDSAVQRSNIVTLSAGASGESSGTGCFVGATNDVFLFAFYDVPNTRVIVLKYIQSTNTASEVVNFVEDLTAREQVRLHRWGDNGALMSYGATKLRLIQA